MPQRWQRRTRAPSRRRRHQPVHGGGLQKRLIQEQLRIASGQKLRPDPGRHPDPRRGHRARPTCARRAEGRRRGHHRAVPGVADQHAVAVVRGGGRGGFAPALTFAGTNDRCCTGVSADLGVMTHVAGGLGHRSLRWAKRGSSEVERADTTAATDRLRAPKIHYRHFRNR